MIGEAYNSDDKQDVVAVTYGIASDGGNNLPDVTVLNAFLSSFLFKDVLIIYRDTDFLKSLKNSPMSSDLPPLVNKLIIQKCFKLTNYYCIPNLEIYKCLYVFF
jgi:hypothetical protein